MQLTSGTRLGPYEIVAPIGSGGMGEVFKARDTRLERSVAIKVLPAEFADDTQFRMRLEREAKTISQLNHPHICTLYDVGHEDGRDFLVMELIEGESLADRLAKGPLPSDHVLRYGAQIADALDRAHKAGVIHRDLKPGNIMITKSGAKLLDFGLAKPQQSAIGQSSVLVTEHKPLTQEGTILGTFQYMAPEQLAGEAADARTDIFALGAMLYEMVTGKRAFEGKTRTSLVSQIIAGEPRPLKDLQPLTPPALEHVIQRCLSKERDDRWQSASDIAQELRWIAAERSERTPTRARVRLFPWIGALVIATLAAALFAVLWWQLRSRPRSPFTTRVLPPAGYSFVFERGALALAPTGTHLVFVASDKEGESSLFVQDFATGEARRLDGTANAAFPFWSPDSRHLAFFADAKLKTVDIQSGSPQTLLAVPDARGGSWSRSGTLLYSPGSRLGLYRVASTGGKPEPVTRLGKGEISHRWPHFLPDGEHALFLVQRAEGGAADDPSTIEIVSLSTGKRRELLRANSSVFYSPPGYLLFWREGSLLAQRFDWKTQNLVGTPVALAANVSHSGLEQAIASVSQEGTLVYHAGGKLSESRLAWSTRIGIHTSTDAPFGTYSGLALSPDARRLAVAVVDQTQDIRVFDLERSTSLRLTFHSADEDSPVWSPDGQWIAFRSNRTDPGDVYLKRASGQGAEEPLVITPHRMRPTDWSADGKRLLIEANAGSDPHSASTDIWLYSLDSRQLSPLVQTPFSEGEAVFSPNGRWIAYTSDESGRPEVYVQSLIDHTRWQVSTTGGHTPRWPGDGRELFYGGPRNAIMAVPVSTAEGSATGGPGTPTPVALFTFRHPDGTRNEGGAFDVTADRQRFILSSMTANTDSAVTVVQNWTEKLSGR